MSSHRYKDPEAYNITPEIYDEILVRQGGVCAICKGPPKGRGGRNGKHYHVDHNHETNKVRGLLCTSCNFLIGHAQESKEILERAISYLEETDRD